MLFIMNKRIQGSLLWFALLLFIWEVTARSGIVSELVLPDLLTVFSSFGAELISGTLLNSTLLSLGFVIAGLLIGGAAAFLLAVGAFNSSAFRRLCEMLTAVLHPLPGIAVLPIFILIFGIGWQTLLFVILHSVTWPLVVNITAGFDAVPEVYRRIGSNYELSTRTFFFNIMVPAAFPYIFSGVKTAWARSWRAAVSAEMVFGITGSSGGLGWFIFSKRIFMDSPGIYAGILMLALLGIMVESGFFNLVEKRTLEKWNGV